MRLKTYSPFCQFDLDLRGLRVNDYDDIAPVFDAVMGTDFLAASAPSVLAVIERSFGQRWPIRHLDLACGTGLFVCLVAQRFQTESYGIDLSRGQIIQAQKQARSQRLHATFNVGDIRHATFPRNCHLVTLNFDSLNHIGPPEQWARLMRRVRECLTDDGLFIFDVNTPQRLERDWEHPEVILKGTLTYVQCGLQLHKKCEYVSRCLFIQVFEQSNGTIAKHSALVQHTAVTKKILLDLLRANGFSNVQTLRIPKSTRRKHIFMKNRLFMIARA